MSDIVTEGIIRAPGAKLLYRSASGLEKAMADVDGERLIGTYAEIVSDQWDPYRISYNNLPYLAYAMGTLLWEEGWSEFNAARVDGAAVRVQGPARHAGRHLDGAALLRPRLHRRLRDRAGDPSAAGLLRITVACRRRNTTSGSS